MLEIAVFQDEVNEVSLVTSDQPTDELTERLASILVKYDSVLQGIEQLDTRIESLLNTETAGQVARI